MASATFCTHDQLGDIVADEPLTVAIRRLSGVTIQGLSDNLQNTYTRVSSETLRHPRKVHDKIGAIEFWTTTIARVMAVKVGTFAKDHPKAGQAIHRTQLRVTVTYDGPTEPTLHFRRGAFNPGD